MIRVEVEPYCNDCLMFDPDVEEPVRMYAEFGEVMQTDTIVRCSNRARCKGLVKYLEKQKDIHNF